MSRWRESRALAAAMLLGFTGVPGMVDAGSGDVVDPLARFDSYPPAIKGEQCVAPVEIMRRRHMELLDLQKDRAIVRGLRNQRFSLQQCVDCHAGSAKATQTEVQRIDAPGQFCAGCHEYVGISIDCFSCHAATPRVDGGGEADGDQRLSVHAFSPGPALIDRYLPGVSRD